MSLARAVQLTTLVLIGAVPAAGQSPDPPTAFVNVTVLTMEREEPLRGQTVLVRDGMIQALVPTESLPLPDDVRVIEGGGRYLMPGLVDAHVHVYERSWFAAARPDFGDGPIYLASGVTSVFNMWGDEHSLEWRRLVESGSVVGPTIYTAGVPVMGPRLRTPDEVEREIAAQADQGYDFIKFYEGLSRPAYLHAAATARRVGIPLVGHAPSNLDLNALLEAGHPLAHTGSLGNVHFLPMLPNLSFLLATAAALSVLVAASIYWVWKRRRSEASRQAAGRLTWTALAAAVVASLLLFAVLPGGPLFESGMLRLALVGVAVVMAAIGVRLALATLRVWKGGAGRVGLVASTGACLAFTAALAAFWIPVAYRSTPASIQRVAEQLRTAGIPVVTTLVVYETLGAARAEYVRDPAIDYLIPEVRDGWRAISPNPIPGYRYDEFTKRVAAALHRAGVTLIAGTDTMGVPLLPPGTSLHRELRALVASGLTPYEALQAATINAARLMKKDRDFGTIATGRRADLILVSADPVADVTRLQDPDGVMVRGRWLPRDALRAALAKIKVP